MSYKDYADYRRNGHLDLSMIENPLGASQQATQALIKNSSLLNKYYHSNEELVELISILTNSNLGNILLSDGADGGLTLASLALFDKKNIVTPAPCFPRYEYYSNIGRGNIKYVPPINDFELDESKVLSEKGDVLLLSTPSNPTGLSVSQSFLKDALSNFNLVVLDEALLYNKHGNEDLLKNYDNLIITRSFSKLYGLAGMRVGYVLSSEKIIKALEEYSSPFKTAFLSQIAALESLKDADFVDKSIDHFKREKDYLSKYLKDSTVNKTETICYLLKLPPEKLKNLAEKRVVVSSEFFKYLPESYVRVSISTHVENQRFLKLLGYNGGEL